MNEFSYDKETVTDMLPEDRELYEFARTNFGYGDDYNRARADEKRLLGELDTVHSKRKRRKLIADLGTARIALFSMGVTNVAEGYEE